MAKTAKVKAPVGRPTKYRPEYGEQMVAFCAEGYSLTSFAAELDVSRSRINEWAAEFPEFQEAVSRAKGARARWWEARARDVALRGGPGGQATMVIFGLKNHAPEDYQDITKQQHTGADGKDLIPAETDPQKIALALMAIFNAAKSEPKVE